MTITKTLSFSLMTASLLMFTACGGGGSSDGGTPPPSNPTNTESPSIVPQKINITIPDGLKTTRGAGAQKGSFQKTTDNIPSYGYEQLKSAIKEAEDTVKDVKKNMLYLGAMMSDIQKECVATAINTQCIIPAGTISLTISTSLESELNDIESEFNTTTSDEVPPINTVLSMGKILYTKFDGTRPYQHDVVLDLQPTLSALGLQVTKQLESMKWSDDNNSVETISDVDDEYGTYNMHLTYNKKNDGSSSMQIVNAFKDKAPLLSAGNFTLSIKDLNDVNNTVEVASTGNFSDGTFNDSFSATGKVSKNGGFLNSKGTFNGSNDYAEKETFDKEGNLLQSKFCDDDVANTCTIDDETTWHSFDDELGIDDTDFNEEEFTNDNDEEAFYIVKAVGGNLDIKEKFSKFQFYDLIPNDIDLSVDSIKNNKIGLVSIFKSDTGELSNIVVIQKKEYINQLDTLALVYYDKRKSAYIKVEDADKPTFNVKRF